MRDLSALSRYAIRLHGAPDNTSFAGAFDIPCPDTGSTLRVVASAVYGWDHVSVSHNKRCPNWREMSRIKGLFFEPHECAMQLHVPDADHVNNHPFCLHLWRPHEVEIPRPPAAFVGVKGKTIDEIRALTQSERAVIQTEAMLEIAGAAHG